MDKTILNRSFITIGTVPPSSGLLIPYSTSLRPFEQRFSWRSFGHVAIRKFNSSNDHVFCAKNEFLQILPKMTLHFTVFGGWSVFCCVSILHDLELYETYRMGLSLP